MFMRAQVREQLPAAEDPEKGYFSQSGDITQRAERTSLLLNSTALAL